MSGIRTMVMRGGTSKGLYFLREDLPSDPGARDRVLMEIMGTPDGRQIDGMGGAHPLTSKVAVVARADDDAADVEYLFLQLGVDDAFVTDRQNCGNLLAGVAPFAVERGLVTPPDGTVEVRIRMLNTDSIATAQLQVRNGMPVYEGDTAISGVPGTAAAITIDFEDIAGGSTGALLPTGNAVDIVSGVPVTLIDNGMPVVVMRADAVGISGYESCSELEANGDLTTLLEKIRLEAGYLMNLGDVAGSTVPKLTMVAPPRSGGNVCTRTFIPHRCHQAIGVLGAVSAATGCLIPGSPGSEVRVEGEGRMVLEHPSGAFEVAVELEMAGGGPVVRRAGIIRTARKLMDGLAFPRSY